MKKSQLIKIINEIYQSNKENKKRVYEYGVYQIHKGSSSLSKKGLRKFGDGKVGKLIHTTPSLAEAKRYAKERRNTRTEGEKSFHNITYRISKLGPKHKSGAK